MFTYTLKRRFSFSESSINKCFTFIDKSSVVTMIICMCMYVVDVVYYVMHKGQMENNSF